MTSDIRRATTPTNRTETHWGRHFFTTPSDLARFRLIYAAYILVGVIPVAPWLEDIPDAFYYPPISLAAVFTGLPSATTLRGLNLLLVCSTVMLMIGWKTRFASIGTALLLLVLNSWNYSLGKINHDILIVLCPFVMAFSGWGRAFSVDSRSHDCEPSNERIVSTGLAVFAVIIGYAMFTAGFVKAYSGWLDPSVNCTYGHLFRNYWATGRETWLGGLALEIQSVWIWKGADWSTVLLEMAFLPAAFHRRAFAIMLGLATLFHLGVLLMMDIAFSANIIAYAAFIQYPSWAAFGRFARQATNSRIWTLVASIPLLLLGASATFRGERITDRLGFPLSQAVVWLGAVIGIGYLLVQFSRVCRALRGTTASRDNVVRDQSATSIVAASQSES